jgi:hypothetical protein
MVHTHEEEAMSPDLRRNAACIATALLATGSAAVAAREGPALLARATDVGNEVVVAMTPESYGTASLTAHTVGAYAFAALDDSVQNRDGSSYNRYSPTGEEVEAALMLPNGALIESIELQGCDDNAAGEIIFILFRVAASGSFELLSPLASTGAAATPGCGFFPQPLVTFHTVNNATHAYYVAVRSSNLDTTSYGAVRVKYRLQVSPAPALATFGDVPTDHPFHRFIEALAAAGITGGCGSGNYCPNQAVTRGQMAVFLSIALGLHFPN